VPKREGGVVNHVLANDTATLVYLAGQNVITPHVWTSRADRLERPDRLIFDLDPAVEDFAEIRATARAFGDLLRDLGLAPHAMTTGSRGLHVTVPLRRTADYPAVQAFARDVAATMAAASPGTLTTEFHIEKRGGRIYLDVNRTRYGQHAVAPYAVRPLPGAPVATPLHWDELADAGLGPKSWSVHTIAERLRAEGDPWAGIAKAAKAVGPAAAALARLTGGSGRAE
jgi:bifunctional non-homologous end joining protein LigD